MEKIAVILAAGIGSRLRPLTNEKPKCMVYVGAQPILEYQLQAYESAGFDKVWIVTGFAGKEIRHWCQRREGRISISFIENNDFDSTNNMYSLWLLKNELQGKSFYMSNGDVIFSDEILLESDLEDSSLLFVDNSQFHVESMKVSVDNHNKVNGISKLFSHDNSVGSSIDIYGFSCDASKRIYQIIDEYIATKKEVHHWTEVAIDALLKSEEHDFLIHDISGKKWYEIDNEMDLFRAEMLFNHNLNVVKTAKVFVFDIDGTLTLGGKIIAGADQVVGLLRGDEDKKVFFCTNNSSKSIEEHAKNLTNIGLECSVNDVISSVQATTNYLKKHNLKKIYVVGTSDLLQDIMREGFEVSSECPEIIVVGFDTSLTYEKLSTASKFISSNIPYILTHPDVSCPTPSGPIPDAGAISKLLEIVTGVEPIAILGKPSPHMLEEIFMKYNKDEVVIIGDRLSTDISMAVYHKCSSVLVLSGITTRADLEQSIIKPSVVLNSVYDLMEII